MVEAHQQWCVIKQHAKLDTYVRLNDTTPYAKATPPHRLNAADNDAPVHKLPPIPILFATPIA